MSNTFPGHNIKLHLCVCKPWGKVTLSVAFDTCVTVCFGIPRTSGWPYCTKPWLLSPAGLGNRPLRPFGIRGLCSRRLQRQIECLKWRCQLRDVKRITASCHNDVMISYKWSRPVGNAILWLVLWLISSLATDRQLNRQPSLSNRVLSRNHSGGSHCFPEIKLCLSYLVIASEAWCTRHRAS